VPFESYADLIKSMPWQNIGIKLQGQVRRSVESDASGLNDPRWIALVRAEREVIERRAELYRLGPEGSGVVAAALRAGGNWDKRTALDFLRSFPMYVPLMLDAVVGHATSHRWARVAQEAIAAADRESVLAGLRSLVPVYLEARDAEMYRSIAGVLVRVEAWEMLSALVSEALESADLDTVEAGEDFRSRYGAMFGG
jgi:hypothetical protein